MYHAAEDSLHPAGTPVYAMADGRVSFSDRAGGYGWLIIIDHPQANLYSLYGHLSPSRPRVRSGEVKKGELIAYLGDDYENGGSKENPLKPHLHFGIRAGQRNDYPARGEWRFQAGWIKSCPQDLGWLQPSVVIPNQVIPDRGFPAPSPDFLARWGTEIFFTSLYIISGIAILLIAFRKKKTIYISLAGIFLIIAEIVLSRKGLVETPWILLMGVFMIVFGIWHSRSDIRRWMTRILAITLLMSCWLASARNSPAQGESAYDLIAQVNGLRSSLGFPAYTVDNWLMSYAQEHANYIASRDSGTHLRPDGSLPWDIGAQENVASGDGVSAYDAVYNIWVDEGHRKTMVGYPSGAIGAGIAYAADGTVYYVIDVRPAGVSSKTVTPAPVTPAPFVPLQTSTPQPDGAIIHIVQPGETLWRIALSYGVTVDEIRRLNGLDDVSTVIVAGQRLLIRLANASSPNPAGETTVPLQATGTTQEASLPAAPMISTLTITAAGGILPTATSLPAVPATTSLIETGKSSRAILIFAIPGALALLLAGVFLYWKSRRG